ncbi:MAG: hypothetical protein AAB453_00570 [Patescibacteria group bacterium]
MATLEEAVGFENFVVLEVASLVVVAPADNLVAETVELVLVEELAWVRE